MSQVALPGAAGQQSDSQRSQLFPALFEQLPADAPLRVFDAGLAVAQTVNFFADYRCRLHFAGLFAELPAPPSDDEALTEQDKEQRLLEQFRQLLDFPAGTQFDICLFWDLFNYLDSTALRAFSLALAPYLCRHTRGHGFVQRDRQKKPPEYQYGVLAEDTLSVRPCSRDSLVRYCHSQAEVERQLSSFGIRRGVLMLDGRLEFLLTATIADV